MDVDAQIGKNASDEDIPPVVPYSIVLWIDTQQLQRELQRLLGVLVPVFLLPLAFRQPIDPIYPHPIGEVKVYTERLTRSRRRPSSSRYARNFSRSFSRLRASASADCFTRRIPCCRGCASVRRSNRRAERGLDHCSSCGWD